MMSFSKRDANLDLLRAAAIVAVIVHHIASMWPPENDMLREYLYLGRFGVDLFFVLSGWLIGGLFWRELKNHGNVQVFRFWSRRSLRTMPPYFMALAISYGVVWIARGDDFDWSYLVFLQNYQPHLPFFRISWSLCVEEHFYLVFPVVAAVVCQKPVVAGRILGMGCLLASSMQLFDLFAPGPCAAESLRMETHLRITGIMLGATLAFVATHHAQFWFSIQPLATWASVLGALAFATRPFWTGFAAEKFATELAAFLFALLLCSVVGKKSLPIADSKIVFSLAIWSYSIYLTHSLVLHVGLLLNQYLPWLPGWIRLLIWVTLIMAAGYGFYRLVELPSIRLRDRFIGRRK
jgi:peptidoglycan/LPS O-acetylase OafA/YrhL